MTFCTVQLHVADAWHDVATVRRVGAEKEGWKARTHTGYDLNWALARFSARDAYALCCQFPVGIDDLQVDHWPAFLVDMLPQGYGRVELLRRLGLSPAAELSADWALLLAGAGNPIGNLRVKEAAEWLQGQPGVQRGFTDEEVAHRAEDFTEYLASHGLFVAGSSGVQGEWPKILLTRAADGLLYLDHALPDAQAREHYLVKFGRGPDQQLAKILRHEAPYMELARMLGLRIYAPLVLRERALFIRRFDRRVVAAGVIRLAQESIATLTNRTGWEALPTHDEVCRELVRYCTDPQAETLEYIKRDIANIALGNKDNHARNTAVQRDFEGGIRLTPLYDFAPMYLHPDGIARRIRWECEAGGNLDWAAVVDKVCSFTRTERRTVGRRNVLAEVPAVARAPLVAALKEMAPVLREIAQRGEQLGLDADVVAYLATGLREQAQRLDALV
jgi:serine/threonine-protein kinase HipA